MRLSIAVLLIPLTAAGLWADGVVKLDSPPKAEWVTIQADPVQTTLSVAGEKAARWVLVDDGPQVDLRAATDGKTASFSALADGQYRILVVSGEDIHRIRMVKGKDPGPGPKPPVPPTPPTPVVDPLVKKFQDAFALDTRAADAKSVDLLDLIELYRQATALTADTAITTTGQLVGKVRKAAEVLQIVGLADVRKVIGAELVTVFPDDVPLDDAMRAKAKATFTRIRESLEKVK